MRRVPFLCTTILLSPVVASAAGVDLTWNDCVGSGTEANDKVFTCTGTLNQSYDLVVQFKSPISLNWAAAVTAIIDLVTDQGSAPLSPFWRYDLGGCQRPSMGVPGVVMSDDIRLLPGCAGQDADLWGGDGSEGSEGIGVYGADFPTNGRGRFVLLDARATGVPLTGGANCYAFHLTFNSLHRDDCEGCIQKAALVLKRITIESTDESPRLEIMGHDKNSNCATINGAGTALCSATLPGTSLTLSVNPSTAKEGNVVRLTASVSPSVAGGNVDFYDGENPIGTAQLAGGTASIALKFVGLGSHSLRADYQGDLSFSGSQSAVTILTVIGAPVITVSDASTTEWDFTPNYMTFRLDLSSPSTQKVTVDYTTLDSTAIAGMDYQARSGRLSFQPGQTEQLIDVPIVADLETEAREYLKLVLTNPSAPVSIGDSVGVGAIVDAPPRVITISDAVANEGDSGLRGLLFTVSMSRYSNQTVTVDITTMDSTATVADNDYQGFGGRMFIPPGAGAQGAFNIYLVGDVREEENEYLKVVLSNPTGPVIIADGVGVGTIVDDDTRLITVADTTVIEGDAGLASMVFRVKLTKLSGEEVTVDYSTMDSTAAAGIDYQAQYGTLRFSPGGNQQLVGVAVVGDTMPEPDKILVLRLSAPHGAIIGRNTALGTIIDDDGPIQVEVSHLCIGTAFGNCVGVVATNRLVNVEATVVNHGNLPVSDWSMDVALSDTSKQAVIWQGIQISGLTLGVGESRTFSWQTGYAFNSGQTGVWQADAVVREKAPGGPVQGKEIDRKKLLFLVQQDGTTATQLSRFDAEPSEDGLEIRWRFVNPAQMVTVSLERSGAANGPWTTVRTETREEGGTTVATDRDVTAGETYWYRLEVEMQTGERLIFGPIAATPAERNTAFGLGRIMPNPSLGATRIEYRVAHEAAVRLSIVDVQGREVAVLREGVIPPGVYQVTWSGTNERGAVPAGLYFARYQVAGRLFVQRIARAR